MRRILTAAVIAAGVTLAAASGVLEGTSLKISDIWYQERAASDGNIVLIGIDQKALEDIGPFQNWERDILAMTIESLNASEDCRPAVIGIDVLFAGERQEDGDAWLAEAAGQYGNVVTACAAEFADVYTEGEDGQLYRDRFFIQAYEEPYPALRETAVYGHINAMLDKDGILRHHLWEIKLPDGREIPSFAKAVANRFREEMGKEEIKTPPIDKNGFWYVPFSGGPGDYSESISVADLLSGERTAEEFAGKIVLIGSYAAGLQDMYVTSADHAVPMYGVEYQANVIQALLWENYKKEVSDLPQFIVLFLLLLLCGLDFWKQKIRHATILWAGIVGIYLAGTRLAYSQGYILHILWIPLGVTVLYIGSIGVNYIVSVLEKRHVTDTFKRYVAPEIVNEVLREKGKGENGGKIMDIAVLFVDVRGFTAMSEALHPQEVVEILNRYLTLIANCIISNEGTLDKFIGDAAMAFWGAPLPQEDYVMKAVRAAEDMRQGSAELSKALMEKYGRTVSFGIGVHVGEAVVGNIGSPKRMDYTAIGDTVNTASRLESNAPGGTIYISRAVADRLKGRICTTSLESTIHLKGKAEGFEILTMDGIV